MYVLEAWVEWFVQESLGSSGLNLRFSQRGVQNEITTPWLGTSSWVRHLRKRHHDAGSRAAKGRERQHPGIERRRRICRHHLETFTLRRSLQKARNPELKREQLPNDSANKQLTKKQLADLAILREISRNYTRVRCKNDPKETIFFAFLSISKRLLRIIFFIGC